MMLQLQNPSMFDRYAAKQAVDLPSVLAMM